MRAQSGGTDMKRLALIVVGCAWARGLAVVLLLASSLATSFAASSFTGFGALPCGSNNFAQAVCDDGKVVVGGSGSARRGAAGEKNANKTLGNVPELGGAYG
jgi:hypothetical protein